MMHGAKSTARPRTAAYSIVTQGIVCYATDDDSQERLRLFCVRDGDLYQD